MKHLKLFEDFRKIETMFELNAEARKYKQTKPLPQTGHARIEDQFEILLWIKSLKEEKFDPMNNLNSFKNVRFVYWFTSKVDSETIKKYALRDFIPVS